MSEIKDVKNASKETRKVKEKENKQFDMGSGSIWSVFKVIWVPTVLSMIISGTLIVFDSIFVSIGYGPWKMFSDASASFDGNAYSALGAAGLASVQPYFLLIAAIGIMIGGGTAIRMTKAKAKGNMDEYHRILNSYVPQNVYFGAAIGLFLLIFAKPLIYLGSGFQGAYAQNWFNSPMFSDQWAQFDYDYFVNFWEAQGEVTFGEFQQLWTTEFSYLTMASGENSWNYIESVFLNNGGTMMAIDASYIALSETTLAVGHMLAQASTYLRIQALFAISFMMMTSSVFVLRVEGRASFATWINLTALIVNIGLDILLVNFLRGNMAGAAIATGIAQTTAAYMGIWYMRNKSPNKMSSPQWTSGWDSKSVTAKEGIPSLGLQLAGILLQWGTVFAIGIVHREWTQYSIFVSGFQGFFSIFTLFSFITIGTVMSMIPIVTYNQEANKPDRVKEMRNMGFSILLGWAVFVTLLGSIFPQSLAVIQTKDPEATVFAMRWSFLFFSGYSMGILTANWMQARGHQKLSTVATFFKPVLIAPVTIIFGFALKSVVFPNAPTAGTGIFLAGAFIDLLQLAIFTPYMYKDWKMLNSEVEKHKATQK